MPVLRAIRGLCLFALVALSMPADVVRADEAMALGVQTHFSQRWPAQHLRLVSELGVPVRDSLPWSQVQQVPGQFRFPRHLRGFLANLERTNNSALLTFADPNVGFVAASPLTMEAAQAYYIGRVLELHEGQVRAIQIGNEINGYPDRAETVRQHVAGLREARRAIVVSGADVPLLGGSVHSVAMSFLSDVFDAGGLDVMDGLALNLYRARPEYLEVELMRLRNEMEARGRSLPFYVTEFGIEVDDPKDAAGHLLKMVAILSDAGVREAYWYALLDQSHFRNMGLYSSAGEEKPALAAFRQAKMLLDTYGNFQRQPSSDLLRHYASADGQAHVIWGAGQSIEIPEDAQVYNASGEQVALTETVGTEPIAVLGNAPEIGPTPVIADSLLQYANPPWRYSVEFVDGRRQPLAMIDWDWTSYLGAPMTRPLAVTPTEVVLSGLPAAPNTVREAMTADGTEPLTVSGTWRVTGKNSDGVRLRILADEVIVFDELVKDGLSLADMDVGMVETLVFELSPHENSTGDRVERHILVRKSP